MAALVLWVHALAALLFGGLALWTWRAREEGLPRRPLALALAFTALWALAASGIGSADIVTRFAETLRNLAWLGVMIALHRRDGVARPPFALGSVYGVVALVTVTSLVLSLVALAGTETAQRIETAAVLMRMLVAVAALVLVQALHSALAPAAGGGLRWIVFALAGIWGAEFLLYGTAYLTA